MYSLFTSKYLCIPPRIPCSTISSILKSVISSSSISVFFKQACHANPGADKKKAGSS